MHNKNLEPKARPNILLFVSIALILFATLTPVNGKMMGNYLDKVAHLLLFLFLSINISYGYFYTKEINIALVLSVLLAILTEVFQQYIPGRNLDILDGISDVIGIALGYFIYQNYSIKVNSLIEKMTRFIPGF